MNSVTYKTLFFNKNFFYAIMALLIGLLASLYRVLPILFNDNVFQDDFGQSYFWLWKLWDKELFNDYYIAEIYKSHLVRTPLVNLIFHLAPYLTDNLLLFSKLLAVLIGSITTLFAYLLSYQLTKNRFIALVYTVFMANVFWFTDHVSNACTRCYLWGGLIAYLYFKESHKHHLASFTCFLMLLMSPFTFLLCLAMEFYTLLLNINYLKLKSSLSKNLSRIFAMVINLISVTVLYLVIFKDIKTQADSSGTIFTLDELKTLPEFNRGGRHPIFGAKLTDGTWFNDLHWGLPTGQFGIYHIAGITIFLLLISIYFYCIRKNLFEKITCLLRSNIMSLLYSSITLYVLAQITFPLLYMPNRYIYVPWLILLILLPFLLFNELFKYLSKEKSRYLIFASIAFLGITGLALSYGLKKCHPAYKKITPEIKEIIEKFQKDSVIAAHPGLEDISMIPITAKRISFVDRERSIAYSKEALYEIRRRTVESFKMVYSRNKGELIKLMESNRVTHFIASEIFYKEDYLNRPRYLRPYNKYLRAIIGTNRKDGFYLDELLKEKGKNWTIIGLDELKKEHLKLGYKD